MRCWFHSLMPGSRLVSQFCSFSISARVLASSRAASSGGPSSCASVRSVGVLVILLGFELIFAAPADPSLPPLAYLTMACALRSTSSLTAFSWSSRSHFSSSSFLRKASSSCTFLDFLTLGLLFFLPL